MNAPIQTSAPPAVDANAAPVAKNVFEGIQMTYQEEEHARLRRQRTKQAIALAMQGRWREAIAANKEIIESFADDVDAYNRLGRAYMELGEYAEARNAYQWALHLDPYNAIAKKNLQRLSHLGRTGTAVAVAQREEGSQVTPPQSFIEEVGKAGVTNLYHLAPPEVLAKMVAGDRVSLKLNTANLTVENEQGEYLGLVDPRIAQRLIRLMRGGNRYSAAVVSTSPNKLTVIIRETYQHPDQAGQLSFPSRGTEGFQPYIGDRGLRRRMEYEEEEAEEEIEPGEEEAELVMGEISPIENDADNEE